MNFRDLFSKRSIRQLIFVALLFALLIPIAIWDSGTQVKVQFNDTSLYVRCDRYNMTIAYDEISSAELVELPEPGEKLENGFDDDIIRAGLWKNDIWGEYHICADLDTTVCVVIKLEDGRTFVFSCKSDKATTEDYEQLKTYLT